MAKANKEKSIIEKNVERLDKKKKGTVLETLTSSIYERTRAWGDKYGFYQKENKKIDTTKYSERVKQLAKIIDEHSWGGHDSFLREAFEIAIGEKFPPSKKEKTLAITFDLGIVVVALSNPNNHGYPIGEPILITKSDGQGIIAEDTPVSAKSLPNNSLTAIRLATKNEIQELLECMLKNKDKNFNTILASFFLENIK